MTSKYKNKIYDGRWKVLGCHNTQYTLENIYNHHQIVIANNTMAKIDKGETTVSNVLSYRASLSGFNPSQPYPRYSKSYKRAAYVAHREIEKKKGK